MTKICAHSGCEKTSAGSLENIKVAIEAGVDYFEVDLRQHGETLYLAHDKIENPEGLVSFDTCLEMLKDTGIHLNCDIKEVETMQKVVDVLKSHSYFDKAVFTGEVHDDLDALYRNNVQYYYNLDDYELLKKKDFQKVLELYNKLSEYKGLIGFNLYYKVMDEDYVEFFNKHNIKLCLWTIDDYESIEKYMNTVDCITTNEIAYALSKRS